MDTQHLLYAPIMKIDTEHQQVFGYASTPTRDRQGEVVLLSAVRNALPGYMASPCLREMHQPSAVGKGIEASVDNHGLWFGGHVVDPIAWAKVKAGVYRGFSIGGRVTERDEDDKSIIKGIDLVEVSLVDTPANPDALFELIKAAPVDLLNKRAGQHLDTGRFVTVAGSREDALTQAQAHEDAAAIADKKAAKHRSRAARAELKADAQGLTVHSSLADANAGLAERHRNAAKQYRDLADKLSPPNLSENPMSKNLNKALEEATSMVAQINKAIDAQDITHNPTEGTIHSAHEEAVQHDAAAIASVEAATKAKADANAARANGNEGTDEAKHADAAYMEHETAAREHHEAAHLLHEKVAAHFESLKKGLENGGNDAASEKEREEAGKIEKAHHEFLAKVIAHHTEHADKCMKCAGECDKCACDGLADHLRKVAGERDAMAKDLGAIQTNLHDEAGQGGNAPTEKFVKGSKCVIIGGDMVTLKDGHFICKREFSDDKRKELAHSGAAMPDGSFPIENKEDLHNAIQAHGRAKDPEKAKRHIIARAKDLGATSMLPEGWGSKVAKAKEPELTEETTKTEDGENEMDKGIIRLSVLANQLGNIMRFKGAFSATDDAALKAWADTGIELLSKAAKEEADGMDDDEEMSDEECEKALQAIDKLLGKGRKPLAWAKLVEPFLAESLVKADKSEKLMKRVKMSKQFKKGCRHLKKAHKRMLKAKQRELVQKGVDLAKNIPSTQDGGTNQGKPGTSHDEPDKHHRATTEAGGDNNGSGKNPDVTNAEATMKVVQQLTAKLTPLLRTVQATQETVKTLTAENAALKARINGIENQPGPAAGTKIGKGGKVTAVQKEDDGRGGETGLDSLMQQPSKFVRKLEQIPPGFERAEALLKSAYVSNN